jgi:dCMP deaminase
MASLNDLDKMFLDISDRVAEMSHSRRAKVGAVIVSDGNIISMGWNGTPSGFDNNCEFDNGEGALVTRPEVLHAESNSILKLARTGGLGSDGGTIYTTFSPCPDCAKLIAQSGIKRVVFRNQYRLTDGLAMLKTLGIEVEQLK